jgi:hypothetical protein
MQFSAFLDNQSNHCNAESMALFCVREDVIETKHLLYTESRASYTSSCHPINTSAAKGQAEKGSNHTPNLCLAERAYCVYLEPFIDALHMKEVCARKLTELIIIAILG